jgi:hypothetical protein
LYTLCIHGLFPFAPFMRLNYFIKKQFEQFCDLNFLTGFLRN